MKNLQIVIVGIYFMDLKVLANGNFNILVIFYTHVSSVEFTERQNQNAIVVKSVEVFEMNRDSHFHQVYKCQNPKCNSLLPEEILGKVKIDGFYRLFCPFCQSEDIRVVSGSVERFQEGLVLNYLEECERIKNV